jgi:glycosyltransferase involved in cell wall biosynthesis
MGFWYNRLNLLLLWVANRRADRIVCNCAAVAAEVGRREGPSRDKLAIVYNGLTLDDHPDESLPNAAAGSVGDIGPDLAALRICLLANLRPIKRMEDFIRAAAKVSERAPGCRFLVVGESLSASYERELRQLTDELALGGKLEFMGPVVEPMRLLRDCHVGVLTSESEGLSNAILEYMSAGLPMVCSDVGGNGELVEHGHNGYLYPCGDVEALAEHLGRLCTNAAERQRMGAASLQRARDFSLERMIESHLQLYTRKGCAHG